MNKDHIIEGILFAMGEPVEAIDLAFALDLDLQSLQEEMIAFIERYNERSSGMKIIVVDDAYQMVTQEDVFSHLIKIVKQPRKYQLTQATLETLAIIAFRQPVTKLDIEKIRGVKSDYMVSRLLMYEMIEEVGRAETIGRPILFGTTKNFLRHFGIANIQVLQNLVAEETADFEKAMQTMYSENQPKEEREA